MANRINRLDDYGYACITVSVIFAFSAKSELSKFSDRYNVSKRNRLAAQVKKDVSKRLLSAIGKEISVKWTPLKSGSLISAMELAGICELTKSDIRAADVKGLSKSLAKTFADKFGEGTTCHVGLDVISRGESFAADSMLTN